MLSEKLKKYDRCSSVFKLFPLEQHSRNCTFYNLLTLSFSLSFPMGLYLQCCKDFEMRILFRKEIDFNTRTSKLLKWR